MFHIEDVLLLKDGEQVKAFSRRHALTLFPGLSLALLLIVIPFFLIFPLFGWGIPGVLIFALAVFAGIVIAMRTLLLWDADVLIVTNMRVVDVDQRGVFSRIVSEAPLPLIQDVSWQKQGMIETVFRMGKITIQTASAGMTITAPKIAHARDVYELINELRNLVSPHKVEPATLDRAARLKSISALLEKYSEEELARVESVLKARERSTLADAFMTQDGKENENEDEDEADEDEKEKDA